MTKKPVGERNLSELIVSDVAGSEQKGGFRYE
jgi:hypothetical protein